MRYLLTIRSKGIEFCYRSRNELYNAIKRFYGVCQFSNVKFIADFFSNEEFTLETKNFVLKGEIDD